MGLLPQVNTFIMYIFEQVDMHVFGGNGEQVRFTYIMYSLALGSLVLQDHWDQECFALFDILC